MQAAIVAMLRDAIAPGVTIGLGAASKSTSPVEPSFLYAPLPVLEFGMILA
jgi:hypothetical protein